MEENKTESKGTRKTVYFGESEDDLLSYALKQAGTNSLSSYLKDLIKKDMNKEPLERTVEKVVEEYLKNKQFLVNNIERPKETGFNNDDINALNKLMGKK